MTDQDQSDALQRIGKYRILGVLGRGSMGVVYRAEDPEIGRVVAVKVLRRVGSAQLKETDAAIERFRLEARSAGQLRHPHVITIFEVNRENDTPYIVMDYLDGEGLDVIIKREGRIAPALAFRYLEQVAKGLDYAHSKGVIHRDVKPSNLLVDRQGNVFVLDFGVASLNESTAGNGAGVVMGTPGYMSPEQILSKPLDARSDLFNFAIVIFECLTGKRPFQGANFTVLINSILQSKPSSLTELAPDLPLSLEAELERGLSKDPADRYPTATELVQALTQSMNGLSDEALRSAAALPAPTHERAPSAWYNFNPLARLKGKLTEDCAGIGQEQDPRSAGTQRPEAWSQRPAAGNDWPRPNGGGDLQQFGNGAEVKQPEARSAPLRIGAFLLGFVCLVLGCAIVWIALRDTPAPEKNPHQEVGKRGNPNVPVRLVDEELHAPPCVAPPERPLREMVDAELIGVIVCAGFKERQIYDALDEARKRDAYNLVEATLVPLKSDSYALRKKAAEVNGEIRDKRIVPYLIEILDDRDPAVRAAVANALGKLGDARALEFMEAMILREENEAVAGEMRRAVGSIRGVP